MDQELGIKYLKYTNIDFEKWNSVIDVADNALIYAHTCFLDMVSDRWSAFIYGDYEYIMPITGPKKMGISLFVQPAYCQQLGIFPTPPEKILNEFIREIRKRFNYVSINFNSSNVLSVTNNNNITPLNNYLLDLNMPYEKISSSYSSHTVRHLKKSSVNNFRFVEYIKPSVYIDFKIKNQSKEIYGKSLKILKNMLPEMISRDRGNIYGIYDGENNMCAAAVLIFDRKRIIYLNGVSSEKGKELNAMYYLMDKLIQKFSGSNLLLDFEGSRIPGVARFFEGFGAKPEVYYNFKYNTLPVPLKWLKK